MKLAIAQLDFLVGDVHGNTRRIIEAAELAHSKQGADAILFPELCLTGYPPEDLLLRPSMQVRVEQAIEQLRGVKGITMIVGYPWREDGVLYNAAGVFRDGELQARYFKQCLPNYQVFDEKRYFEAGDQSVVFDFFGIPTTLTICEDIWFEEPIMKARAEGARLCLNLNASPYHMNKMQSRRDQVCEMARSSGMPIVYANCVGGQDELVFDGGSMIAGADGELAFIAPEFEPDVYMATITAEDDQTPVQISSDVHAEPMSIEESVYHALVLGVRDYIDKNGFRGVVLGLSGGIDSALTLAVAVDALGPERVEAVMMPFRYTSEMSLEDAAAQAKLLEVKYQVKPIESIYEAFMQQLQTDFKDLAVDATEENLQSRCRGVLLMALSNKSHRLVLTTGNKSEMAVGYATLYGDMAGGFDVLKDVPKTLVYRLSNFRNALTPDAPPIPQRVIDRPPSAELAPDQQDSDSLPDYDILDQILERYIERDESATRIIEAGFDEATVKRVIRLVDINEYKRRQAPVGVRITPRGFGRDRRYPITFYWPAGD